MIKVYRFYDAPISGGEAGAVNGTLSVMFGGPAEKITSIKKLMRSYSSSIVHIGPSGHGQLTKMVNQLCIAGLLQGLSEGMAFGKESKLNMSKVFDAISNGAAQSWQMDNRYKSMLKDEFSFGFAVDLMIKDLKIALNESKNNQLDLKTSKEVLKIIKIFRIMGVETWIHQASLKLLNKIIKAHLKVGFYLK